MNRCPKCGAYLDPGEKCDCEAEEMDNTINSTMVMVTRAEFEEYVKLKTLQRSIINKHRKEIGASRQYISFGVEMYENLFGDIEYDEV